MKNIDSFTIMIFSSIPEDFRHIDIGLSYVVTKDGIYDSNDFDILDDNCRFIIVSGMTFDIRNEVNELGFDGLINNMDSRKMFFNDIIDSEVISSDYCYDVTCMFRITHTGNPESFISNGCDSTYNYLGMPNNYM